LQRDNGPTGEAKKEEKVEEGQQEKATVAMPLATQVGQVWWSRSLPPVIPHSDI